MLGAFGAIAWCARREDSEERFRDLYLDHTAAGTREVSVLFADLEGFTQLRRGPRAARGVRDAEHLPRGRDPADRDAQHGGEIDRLIGDAIMATWGTRGDQPDHAERAVRAAVDLQRETQRIADQHPGWPRFRAADQQRRGARRGAGRGERAQLHGGRRHRERRRAARERWPPPAGVVIGGRTLRAVPGLRVTALGPLEVKGKQEPVEAYRLELRSL